MWEAVVISFIAIFIAELGDKSQLMAMTFAARYKAWVVLLAITAATAVVHLASVAIGAVAGAALPVQWVNLLAGIAFIIFGLWTLRGDELSDEEAEKAKRPTKSVFFAVAGAFFLAELGDKTMLATITVATTHGWFGTWIGSTVGMVAADALAIGVGAVLGKALPERTIRIGASILFFVAAAWLLYEAYLRFTGRA